MTERSMMMMRMMMKFSTYSWLTVLFQSIACIVAAIPIYDLLSLFALFPN